MYHGSVRAGKIEYTSEAIEETTEQETGSTERATRVGQIWHWRPVCCGGCLQVRQELGTRMQRRRRVLTADNGHLPLVRLAVLSVGLPLILPPLPHILLPRGCHLRLVPLARRAVIRRGVVITRDTPLE